MTLVYLPVAHWVWGGGFLAKLGALDFAGGTVVHINAGIAALVGSIGFSWEGNEAALKPSNLTLVITGAGLLWFGWFGFNAGSALGSKRPCRSSIHQYEYGATALAAISGCSLSGCIPRNLLFWVLLQVQLQVWFCHNSCSRVCKYQRCDCYRNH